jgi:uncharacterized membrane protein YgcG
MLDDDTGSLDRARVEGAAAPLIRRGAVVVVVIAGSGDDRGEDFARRLEAAGLLQDSQIVPDGIGLYVSREPRYSELRAGSRWSRALPDETLRSIRQETLNPALRADTFTEGVAATLAALEVGIADASTVMATALAWLGTAFRWLAYGVVLAVILYFVGLVFESPLERLRRVWLATPPGRLLAWLWEQTPPGRRRAQRIRTYRLARARTELEHAADDARHWCRQAASVGKRKQPIDYLARLRPLDQQRKRLERGQLEQVALLQGLTELAKQYRTLADEARQASPQQPAKKKSSQTETYYSASTDYSPSSSSSYDSSSYDSSSGSYDSSSSSGGESRDGGSW